MMYYALIAILTLIIIRLLYLYMQKKLDILAEENNSLERQKELAFNFLDKSGTVLLSGEKLEKRLDEIGNFIIQALNADSGAIFLRYKEDYVKAMSILGEGIFPPLIQTIDKVFTHKKYIKEKLLRDIVPIRDAKIIGHVLQTGQAQTISDASRDPRIPQAAAEFVEIKSMMVAPLKVNERIMGVCVVVNKCDGDKFNAYEQSLFENLVNYAALILDLIYMSQEIQVKQRLQQEMSTANDVQKLLLPKDLPQVEGYDFFGFNSPAKELGGDYYDFIDLGDGKIGVAIADVSGKGVAAALVMATLRGFLRLKAPAMVDDPVALMKDLNDLMYKDTKENMFITMTYGVLDTRNHLFRAVRAGHEQIFVFSPKKEKADRYVPRGMALGIVEPDFFQAEEVSIHLDSSDVIVLYTDGVTEAMDKHSNEYGLERFEEKVQEVCGTSTQTIFSEVDNDLKKFTQGLPQNDDITTVLIKKT